MSEYGKRKCMQCEKSFFAVYPGQVCCSKECQAKRRKEAKAASNARRLPCTELEWLNGRYEKLLAEHKAAEKKACGAREKIQTPPRESEKAVEPEKKNIEPKPVNEPQMEAKSRPPGKYRHVCENCGTYFKSNLREDQFCCEECLKEHLRGHVAI